MYNALIIIISLTALYVIDINFPLHRLNLWRRLLVTAHVAPRPDNLSAYSSSCSLHNHDPATGLKIPDGPKFTPNLRFVKVAVVSDSMPRINNFIKKHLKGDPYDLKYLKIACTGKLDKLGEKQLTDVHLIYGWDNLPGMDKWADALALKVTYYGNQLFMKY